MLVRALVDELEVEDEVGGGGEKTGVHEVGESGDVLAMHVGGVAVVSDVDVVVVEGFSNVDTRSIMGLTQAVEKNWYSSCLIASVIGGGVGTYGKICEEQENGREQGSYISGPQTEDHESLMD